MLFCGSTIDEAIRNAEIELNASRDDLEYEIISDNEKFTIKILGRKGKIGVKAGNLVFIDGDIPPTLKVGEGIEAIVNGVKVESNIKVNKNDVVRIIPRKIEGKRNLNIRISEDSMTAYVDIFYEPFIEYEVVDKDPAHELFVEGKIKNKVINKFTADEIEMILKEKKIVYGIKRDAILQATEGGTFIIAEGKKPLEPTDDKIIYYFGTSNNFVNEDENMRIDHFNRNTYEYVEKGSLLAEKIEGNDGMIGFDVFGRPVKPRKRQKVNILAGSGCEVVENKAIAKVSGMPEVKENKIYVFDVLKIDSDVDIRTGNIKFDGNIEVFGSVREGFKVQSSNNIFIHGDVLEAEIISNGNVYIKNNLISSNITAGIKQLNDENAIEYIRKIFEVIKNVLTAYLELIKTGKLKLNRNIGHVLNLILMSKYPTIGMEINKYDEFISKNYQNEILTYWRNMYRLISEIKNNNLHDYGKLNDVLQQVNSYLQTVDISNSPADVKLSYSQNSKIFASNNVEIIGKGCYNTNIVAKNVVKFLNEKAIFRGGQITADNGIFASEVGSIAGVLTVLKTSKQGVIEAKIVYQNSILYFDEIAYKIEYPVKNLKAHYQKGELYVEKIKL